MNKLIIPIIVIVILIAVADSNIFFTFQEPAFSEPFSTQEPKEKFSKDSPFGFLAQYIDNSRTKQIYDVYGGFSAIQEVYKDLGVHWDRGSGGTGGAFWGLIEKNIAGYAREFDNYVNTANKNNINLLITIVPGYSKTERGEKLPTNLNAYAKFVKALVQRYSTVKYWQINNEVNGGYFWKDTPENYAELVRITSNAIKENCPDCKIVLGSSVNNGKKRNPESYMPYFEPVLKELENDDKKYFDIFDYHLFLPRGYAPESYYRALDKGIDSVRGLLDKHGYGDVDIWITETMIFTTDGMNKDEIQRLPEEYRAITEKQQALALIRVYVSALSKGVKKIFWNKLTEGPWSNLFRNKLTECNFMFNRCGLIRHPNSSGSTDKKLSYYTYKLMVEKLEGSNWDDIQTVKEEQGDADGIFLYKFMKNGKPIYVGWYDCFYEQKYSKMERDTRVEIPVNKDIDKVKITEAVPKYESGRDVTDYYAAFNTQTKAVQNGKVTIILGENPVFIEEE